MNHRRSVECQGMLAKRQTVAFLYFYCSAIDIQAFEKLRHHL